MKLKIYLVALLTVIASCTDQVFDPEVSTTVVVQGYLYDGQHVREFNLSQLIPFEGNAKAFYEIEDAEVYIGWQGNSYLLVPNEDERGYYYYDGDDLIIASGEEYQLTLTYFDKEVTSTTTVPKIPKNARLSEESVAIAPIESFEDIQDRDPADQDVLEIVWDNPSGDNFYVVVENIESNPEDINQIGGFPGGGNSDNFRFVTDPTTADVYNITPFSLTQYGVHRVVLYSVNQEYADLYETAEQDSRSLSEPLTNIENGLGIFTAFASDTLYFEVVEP